MEIAGYPMLNWLARFAILGIVGWATSFPLVMLMTLRVDGKPANPNSWLTRSQWVVAAVLAVIYLILLGNAISWQIGPNDSWSFYPSQRGCR